MKSMIFAFLFALVVSPLAAQTTKSPLPAPPPAAAKSPAPNTPMQRTGTAAARTTTLTANPNLKLFDKDAEIRKLRDKNHQLALQLERANKNLQKSRQLNDKLNSRIHEMTSLGGSQVHAYCKSHTVSRNTAGIESNCATPGGFACEPVSGLCRTQCSGSDQCATGFVCDPSDRSCKAVSAAH